jgi:hypothetical protein
MVLLFLLLTKGRIVTARQQRTEVIEAYQLLFLSFFLPLAVIHGKRLYQSLAVIFINLKKQNFIVELSQLRGRHDGILVVANDADNVDLVGSVLDAVLTAVLLEYLRYILLHCVVP